jgi:O-antigen/teichoic acid export membrane protein
MLALLRHSALFGLAGLVQRVVSLLLVPVYTRQLHPVSYGRLELLVAITAVLVPILRSGVANGFFRLWFEGEDERRRRLGRTAFWFTMATATLGMLLGLAVAAPLSEVLWGTSNGTNLVRVGAVALFAQVNYEQLTAFYRVEQRSRAYAAAALANLAITVALSLWLVVGLQLGPTGALAGNVSGTLAVWLWLVLRRRRELTPQIDRDLLRGMQHFGLPLVPAALLTWAVDFSDRLFVNALSSQREVGIYSLAAKLASASILFLTAFRLAWPAFAYSIEDDDEAKRTYGYVLTYAMLMATWIAVGLGLLAPWLVRILADPAYREAWHAVGLLALSVAGLTGYTVLAIGTGRAKRTQMNWVVSGVGAVVAVGLNFALIPAYGSVGAATATLAAYVTMFVGMAIRSQQVYPIPYQWRRVTTIALVGGALVGVGALQPPLFVALPLACAFPLVLLPLGFYLPAERVRVVRLLGRTA